MVHVKGVKAHIGHNLIVFGKVIERDGVRDGLNYHSRKIQLCVSLRVRHQRRRPVLYSVMGQSTLCSDIACASVDSRFFR